MTNKVQEHLTAIKVNEIPKLEMYVRGLRYESGRLRDLIKGFEVIGLREMAVTLGAIERKVSGTGWLLEEVISVIKNPPVVFKKPDRVLYVPDHAEGDEEHPDCQRGCVKRVTDEWVFVLYDNAAYGRMATGDEPYTAQGTHRRNLRKL